jgi:hypothetical protein
MKKNREQIQAKLVEIQHSEQQKTAKPYSQRYLENNSFQTHQDIRILTAAASKQLSPAPFARTPSMHQLRVGTLQSTDSQQVVGVDIKKR